MQEIVKKLQKWKKIGVISLLLILAFISGNSTGFARNDHVGETHVLSAHTLPSPTMSPSPTNVPITVINNIIIPTQAPVVLTQVVTPTPIQSPSPLSPTPTPTPFVQPTEETPSPTPTVSLTPTPTPIQSTPLSQSIEIDIAYAGAHAVSAYTVSITPGETAWQAVQDGLGIANVQYTDYGESLGIFITGFNGIDAASNQYYDFQVNGASSSVGISSYSVLNHDVLKFVLTNF